MSVKGSSLDILTRVRKEIPGRWFKWAAPIRDAILGGLSDSAAWLYTFIGYARSQTRISSAYGIWLDIIAYDFLGRAIIRSGSPDSTFRQLIKATILQERVTRKGMVAAVTTLTGNVPQVFEPWNTNDTGAYSGPNGTYGSMGYGVGNGGYGNMNLPGQAFLKVTRSGPAGVPGIGGYGNAAEGYGVGRTEYVGSQLAQVGVTNDAIERLISLTKPTGTTMWVAIGVFPPPMAKRPMIFNSKANSQNIAII